MSGVDSKLIIAGDNLVKTIEVSPNARVVIYVLAVIVVLFLVFAICKFFLRPASQKSADRVMDGMSKQLQALNENAKVILDRQATHTRAIETLLGLNHQLNQRFSIIETKVEIFGQGFSR